MRGGFALLLCLSASSLPAPGQPVLSARSGLVVFFEGQVSVDGKPLVPDRGRFSEMRDGAVLSTRNGKAEVLLTPGVYLRMDHDSSFRLESGALSDTRVELLGGEAIVSAMDRTADTSVTMILGERQLRVGSHGSIRIGAGGFGVPLGKEPRDDFEAWTDWRDGVLRRAYERSLDYVARLNNPRRGRARRGLAAGPAVWPQTR